MKDEIKEILDNLKDRVDEPTYFQKVCGDGIYEEVYNDYCLTPNKCKELYNYITNLQEKVDQYENPDDLTLFYMWLDEKAKDKIKQLQEENKRLKELCDKYEEEHSTTFEYWKNQIETNKHPTLLQGEDYNKVERAYLDDEWIGEDKDVKD